MVIFALVKEEESKEDLMFKDVLMGIQQTFRILSGVLNSVLKLNKEILSKNSSLVKDKPNIIWFM